MAVRQVSTGQAQSARVTTLHGREPIRAHQITADLMENVVVVKRVGVTYAAWVIALAARQVGRPDLIRSPRLVLAHVWEGVEL